MALTDAQLAQYLDAGYLAVDDLLPASAFDLLIAELEANIDVRARELAAQGKLDDLGAGLTLSLIHI